MVEHGFRPPDHSLEKRISKRLAIVDIKHTYRHVSLYKILKTTEKNIISNMLILRKDSFKAILSSLLY